MTRLVIRRALAFVGLLAMIGSLVVGVASAPAQAAARDGVCDSGEFCYYYNSNYQGSVSDHGASLGDYGTTTPSCYVFKSSGAGQGQCIKNNAASVFNRTSQTIRVYYNSNHAGSFVDIAPGTRRNLAGTCCYNENASHGPKPSDGGGGTGGSYAATNNYPYRGQGTGVDPWNFYKGQCTSWSAWALRDRVGVAFHNYYKDVRWGNAHNWDNAARSVGVPVYTRPRAGDIAVREGGTYGHVAFVRAVNSDGTFWVEEYNYVTADAYSHRKTSVGTANSQFSSFIRFK